MRIKRLLNTERGKMFVSILLGLGLASLFRKACKGRSCIIIKGPKPSEMHNKIYKFDNKCYRYESVNTICKK